MRKKFTAFFAVATLLLVIAGGLFSCGDYTVMDFTAFNTQVYIAVKGNLSAEKKSAVKELFSQAENSLSLNNDGDVAAFNSALSGEKIPFSGEVFKVAEKSKELYDFTDGLFNPAVLPLLRLWKLSSDTFDSKIITFTPPTEESVSSLIPLADFSKITFDNGTAEKREDDLCVDFGGIVKGYVVDKVKDILYNAGITEGYISVGGSSIFVFSTEEDLSVKHPRKTGEYVFTVDKSLIKDSPLSTSGDYMRYYTDKDGKRYSHIINGFTGLPADTGIISATVIAGERAESSLRSACATDAISTALMLMEKESATEFIRSRLQGFYVFIVFEKDGVKEVLSNTENLKITDADYAFSLI